MGWVGPQLVDSVCCAAKVRLHRTAFALLSACRRKEVTARCAHAPASCCDTSYQPLRHLHLCHLPTGVLVSAQIGAHVMAARMHLCSHQPWMCEGVRAVVVLWQGSSYMVSAFLVLADMRAFFARTPCSRFLCGTRGTRGIRFFVWQWWF